MLYIYHIFYYTFVFQKVWHICRLYGSSRPDSTMGLKAPRLQWLCGSSSLDSFIPPMAPWPQWLHGPTALMFFVLEQIPNNWLCPLLSLFWITPNLSDGRVGLWATANIFGVRFESDWYTSVVSWTEIFLSDTYFSVALFSNLTWGQETSSVGWTR